MRTANAWTSKLKAEALGRTFKVQNTNHKLTTGTLYRGAAACGPLDYNALFYAEVCKCDYLVPCPIPPAPPPVVQTVYDGGSPAASGPLQLDGGNPAGSGPIQLDGGNP